MNYLSILVIIGYIVVINCFVDEEDYLKILGLTLITAIVICQLKSRVEGLDNSNSNSNSNSNTSNRNSDNFGNISAEPIESPSESVPPPQVVRIEPSVSPIDSKLRIGPYDGLCVRTLNQKFRDYNNSLIDNNKLMNFQGVQGPVQNVVSDNSDLTGPTVDGEDESPQRLFMFANNKASLNCCPSTYSTDRGCVCSTEKQDKFIRRRGYNNSA